MHLAVLGLLVLAHSLRHVVDAVWVVYQKQCSIKVTLKRSGESRIRKFQLFSQIRGIHHAEGYSVSMIYVVMSLV